MAQPNKTPAKPSTIKIKDKKPAVYGSSKNDNSSLFASLDNWFEKHSKAILIVILSLCVLFSLLLFQARMDIGGDDSTYILRAFDFIHKGAFPSFQGPLYPIFLSIFVSFLGIKVILLKFLSVLCNFIALFFLYKSFKGRVPPFVLYSALLLTAINAFILSYASLTYSEAFFSALQFIFIYLLFKLLDKIKNNNNLSIKDSWKNWIWVGLILFLLASARSAGIFAIGGLILYFAFRKQFRYILYVVAFFLLFNIPIGLIENIIWHTHNQFSQQGSLFLQKDPYNAAIGNENFNGFIARFFRNCDLYLSKRFFQIIGLRSMDVVSTISWLSFLFVSIFIFCVYRIVKSKNNYLLAASLYTLSMTGMTFLVLQVQWDQPRLIMVFVPLYMIIFIYGLYDLFKKRTWVIQFSGVCIIVILVLFEFRATFKKAGENLPALSKNLQGDIYYGFTPDWVNYLKMSQWCENLPKDSLVACRKRPMSSVYSNGRPFFNVVVVDSIHSNNADSVISWFKRNNVHYILLAKLRLNPSNPDQGFINTMLRLIAPVARKYPQKLKFIRQEGATEEAQLYEVLY